MRVSYSASLRHFLPVAAILIGGFILVLNPLPLQTLRNAIFDQFQRWHPRAYHDVGVRIVDIDDESLNRLGQWPWPRDQVAKLVTQLDRAGAASIAFDVIFAEPDRTSPSAFLRRWPLPSTSRTQVAALPDPDEQFALALHNGRTVLGIAEAERGTALPSSNFSLIEKGTQIKNWVPKLSGTVAALPVLANNAAGNGTITFIPDSDGIVRRVPMLVSARNTVLPSLVAESLRVSQTARNILVHGDASGISQIDIGKFHVPTAADGQFWIHFSRPAPNRTIPAWQVINGSVPADSLRGSMIVIGTSAQGLQDLRFSPLGGVIPGVEIHAQALEQIRSGSWLQRPAWALPLEALIMLVGSAALCLLALRSKIVVSTAAALTLLLGLNFAGWIAFRDHQLLLDIVTPSIGIGLAYILASLSRHIATEAKQRWIQQAFARYVSPNRVAYLMANPRELELGGRRQECSFIFSDLTDFTSLIENTAPDAAVEQLNDYLEGLVQIAFRHDGTLDRIVGDAVAIMFSAPVPQADHRTRALACALEMQEFAARYASSLHARDLAFGTTRIGVHAGEVVVGNFGGRTIFDYRAMGDAVNVTARLETLNRHVGTTMCVSEVIRAANPDIPMRPVGNVVLKGKNLAVAVFEPLSMADVEYETAYALLAASHDEALNAFEALARARPADRLIAFHLQRLRSGLCDNLIVMENK